MKDSVLARSAQSAKSGCVHGRFFGESDHLVQFYESDEYLICLLTDFVKEGLEAGDAVILLATSEHLTQLHDALRGEGFELPGTQGGRYYAVEARDVLERVMVNGRLQKKAFDRLISETLVPAAVGGKRLRIFGELVALLAEKGFPKAALQLERLWESLRQVQPFSLFCAYPIQHFSTSDKEAVFRQICEGHSRVIPTEHYSEEADTSMRLRTIAQLQQQARSYTAEAAQRERAEARWHDSETRMRQLLDVMPNAVYVCDANGRITYFNRRAVDLWGQSPELGSEEQKFCGTFRLWRLDGSALPHPETPMAQAIREGTSTREGEVVIERPNGSKVTLSVNVDPILDERGRITGAINVFQDITKRKAMELELRRRTDELTAFVEHASVGLHWSGPDGVIQWANRAELELFGYEWNEYVGHHLSEFHVDQEALGRMLAELANGERIFSREARIKCKDGSIKHVAIDSSVLWEDGKFVHTQSFTRDISQQRAAEELSARFAAIVHSSDDAILSIDLEGKITSWNLGAEKLYGYSAVEIIGQPIDKLIPAERRAEDQRIFDLIRGGERIDHYETTRRRKGGALVDVSLTVSAIRDSSGAIVGASKIARDITERKRAEARQRALYDLVAMVNRAGSLAEVFDSALDAICRCQETDRASILLKETDGSMRFKAWRGLSDEYRSAVEGHSPWKSGEVDAQPVLVGDVGEMPLDPKLKGVILSEGIRAVAFIPIRYECRLLGKFMLYYREPRQFKAEEVLSAQTIASQLAFAIERQQTGEFLERLVRERTASLQQAIAQMEEFSYTVSHDLRAPLRGMQGYTDALLEDFSSSMPPEAQLYLARIKENALRLDRMILDVLAFARLARADLRLEPVDLDALVRRIVEHHPGMQEPHASISIEPLGHVLGHEPSLTQAITNLLTNGTKFVPPGVKPRIKVWGEVRGGHLRVWFEDNGIGIDPKFQHRLFNMFERVHPNLRYDGTGVGLAIVRKAMERVGGSVGVESDGLHGSRFWIEAKIAQAGTSDGAEK